ncbi:MAG: cardiolipin synthase ClsB [Elusimicrobia bacterium]|nr:cardiolipin synthase ClsB [Elusimicrobiota bacterium]
MELQSLRTLLRRARPGSGDFSRHLDQYIGGNKLALLPDGGAVFRAMWDAIDAAKETINLETYILRSDQTGLEFSRRLQEKARRGVRVRLIFDSVGSMDIDPVFVNRLRNSGVQILEYHPIAPWRPRWSWGRRDHRKILVVDGKTAFTGGVNISDAHLKVREGGEGWRDAHVQLEGPAAYELDRLFRAVWFRETGRWFRSEGHPEHKPAHCLVWVAANQEFVHRYRIRSAYLNALRASQREVLIANAYFLPDRRIRRALGAAARRGVSVKILVQGRSDILSVWYASRYRYDFLLRHGVRLFQYSGSILHAKIADVDGVWSAVGSYNMDHRSLMHNLEVNLHVLDREFSVQLAHRIKSDMAESREIKLSEWRRRPWSDRLLEWFFYLFRYFF